MLTQKIMEFLIFFRLNTINLKKLSYFITYILFLFFIFFKKIIIYKGKKVTKNSSYFVTFMEYFI